MTETQPDPRLEIAHVLFMDIVGFSKSLINEQSEMLRQLNQVVRDTAQVKAAEASGQTPMTGQGTCCQCNKATVVVFYES